VTRRYNFMIKALKVYSAENWGNRFIECLEDTAHYKKNLGPLIDTSIKKEIKALWKKSKKRLIFLDYDGTMTDIVSLPKFARPSWEIIRSIKRLVADPKNHVMIVSGRPKQVLEEWLMTTGAYLCAEHGAWIWDGKEWQKTYKNTHPHWKDNIRPIMQNYTERTAGSFIEEKDEALAWHYRLSEPDYGTWQANNLAFNLESLLSSLPVHCLMGKKVVEVRHRSVHKGTAWKWMKKKFHRADFILGIGDDRTDEDLFMALPDKAHTLHVGMSDSAAKYRINSPTEVRAFLKYLIA